MDRSPTGTPFISPKAVPLVVALWAALNAGVLALPEGGFKHGALIVLNVAGPVLGMFCPGIRKAP